MAVAQSCSGVALKGGSELKSYGTELRAVGLVTHLTGKEKRPLQGEALSRLTSRGKELGCLARGLREEMLEDCDKKVQGRRCD